MDLPGSFRRYGTPVLARYPVVGHQWSVNSGRCELLIPASTPTGFDIDFVVLSHTATVRWGRWHTQFEPEPGIDALVESLFGLLRDMLSPDMRIRELWAWPLPYRGFLEAFDGARWSTEQEMGLIFWNYVGRRSVQIYSNSVLPSRTSTAGQGAAPDHDREADDVG